MGLFFLAILLPGAGYFLVPADEENTSEKRQLHEFPSTPESVTAVAAYPTAFEAWHNDHFGFRNPLIFGHNLLKYDLLGVSPTDDVVVGKDGWLFSAADYEREYALARPATHEDLSRFTAGLEALRDMLADRGIRFLFVIAPNKGSIYSEYLPAPAQPIVDESPLDQLAAYLAAHSDLAFLDLRPVLRAGKELGLTYLKTDTHWNARGRLLAANAVLERLGEFFDGLSPYPIASYAPYEKTISGDLANMMALSGYVEETVPQFFAPKSRAAAVTGPVTYPGFGRTNQRLNPARRYMLWTNPRGRLRAMMLRDSFGQGMAVYLAEHFQRLSLAPRDSLDTGMLDRERPHVVIVEWVERYLCAPGGIYDPRPGI